MAHLWYEAQYTDDAVVLEKAFRLTRVRCAGNMVVLENEVDFAPGAVQAGTLFTIEQHWGCHDSNGQVATVHRQVQRVVQQTGNLIECETTEIPWTHLFQQLHVKLNTYRMHNNVSMTDDEADRQRRDGVYNFKKSLSPFGWNYNTKTRAAAKELSLYKGDNTAVSCSNCYAYISANLDFELKYRLSIRGPKSVDILRVVVSGKLWMNFELQFKASGRFKASTGTKTLAQVKVPNIVIWIGVLPFYITPVLSLYASADFTFGGQATVTYGFDKSWDAKLGVTYEKGRFNTIQSYGSTAVNRHPLIMATRSEVHATLNIIPELKLTLNKLLDVFLQVLPQVGADVVVKTSNTKYVYNVDAYWGLKLGVKTGPVSILGFKLLDGHSFAPTTIVAKSIFFSRQSTNGHIGRRSRKDNDTSGAVSAPDLVPEGECDIVCPANSRCYYTNAFFDQECMCIDGYYAEHKPQLPDVCLPDDGLTACDNLICAGNETCVYGVCTMNLCSIHNIVCTDAGATCLQGGCVCRPGYHLSYITSDLDILDFDNHRNGHPAAKCEPDDECALTVCGENAFCLDGQCFCAIGYAKTAHGSGCAQHSTPCSSNATCHANSTCLPSADFDGELQCLCDTGLVRLFHSNGQYECLPRDNVCAHANCSMGDEICSIDIGRCVAIDPCLVDNGGCFAGSDCVSTGLAGRHSCVCRFGYHRTGPTTCVHDNPCMERGGNGGCDMHASCQVVASADNEMMANCTCKNGYIGDGDFCEHISPCIEDNGGCAATAICWPLALNSSESSCQCRPGYEGDGYECSMVHPCSVYATCDLAHGTCSELNSTSRICGCIEGYTLATNGVLCEPLPT